MTSSEDLEGDGILMALWLIPDCVDFIQVEDKAAEKTGPCTARFDQE